MKRRLIILLFLLIKVSLICANDYQKIELGSMFSNYELISTFKKGSMKINFSLFDTETYSGVLLKYKSFSGTVGSKINIPFEYTPFFNGLYLGEALTGDYNGKSINTKFILSDSFMYIKSGTQSIGLLASKKDELDRIGGYISYALDNENAFSFLSDQYQIELNVAFQDIRSNSVQLGQTLYVFTQATQDEGELPVRVTIGYLNNEVAEHTLLKSVPNTTNYDFQSTFLDKQTMSFSTPVLKFSTSKSLDQNTVYLDIENYSALSLYLAKITAEIKLDKRLGILFQTMASSGKTPYSIRASVLYEIPTKQ